MPARVVVDGSSLHDGSAVRGIGSVLRPLLEGLARRDDLDLVTLDGVTPRGPGRSAPWERLLRGGVAARRARGDVTWFPANLAPPFAPRPFVATVHDVIPLVLDDPGLAADRRRWKVAGRLLRRAATVLVPSEATRDAAVTALGLRPERTTVVPWGVATSFTPDGPRAEVAHPHVLWVSAFDAHKGLAEACRVIAGIADLGLPHRLRLLGPFDEWNRRLVEQVVAASPRPDLVDVVGWVDDLPAAYRAAAAFIVTSKAEGFGLTPLEAQASGLPVVGFACAAVAEVAGPGARLVPLGDVDALVDAAADVLADEEEWSRLVSAGRANAARFTWEAAVDAYAAAFLRAASPSA